MKVSVYWNNRHIFDRVPFAYRKITSYKSGINVMKRYNTDPISIVKIIFPQFNIATD